MSGVWIKYINDSLRRQEKWRENEEVWEGYVYS